jgi:uncharacterized protein (TIGR02597 family)
MNKRAPLAFISDRTMKTALTIFGTGKTSGWGPFWVGSLFFFLLCIPAFPLDAQTPMGFAEIGAYDSSNNYLGLLANSDTLVSIPFIRPPAYTGTVASVSNNVITVNESTHWTANQFVYAAGTQTNTYYALIGPSASGPANPKEGCTYLVTASGTNTVTLSLNGDNISSIPVSSQITLIPYWTLATLFPASNANVSFTPTTSTRSFKTEVLIPDYSDPGINLASTKTYYFISSGANIGWRLFGDATTTDHSNDVLIPDGYVTVRNQNGSPTLPLIVSSYVPMSKLTVPLTTLSTGPQDNATSVIRPLDVSLNNCGLNPAAGSFTATTSTRSFKDQLFLYSNSQVAFNKSASATYYYMNNGWRLFGDAVTTDHGNDLILAGSALTIRKATGSGQTAFWTNTPTY